MRTDAFANALLDANDDVPTANTLALSHAALFTGFPGRSGTPANEVTGGAPAYARKAVTWSAASARARSIAATQTFDIPAGTTVQYAGICSAVSAGSVCDYGLIGNQPVKATSYDGATNTFTSEGHGYSNDQRVALFTGPEDSVPTGATEGTLYWVVSAATDTFQLSATQGGAAVDITSDGECLCQRGIPETFASQGTFDLTGYTIQEKL